jgi:hypothetical protein
MRSSKTGSVLMEFVIVLPIYLILLGFVFMIGEMSLHGVHLAASGDRTIAVAQGGEGFWESGWNLGVAESEIARAISPSSNHVNQALNYREEGVSANVSRFKREVAGKVEDPGFAGSWSWLVASTLRDEYTLTPWTRGMVKTWANMERMVKMTEPPESLGPDTVLSRLFSGVGVGRVSMTSKDLGNVNTYAYYTLMRNNEGRKSYRSSGHGGLVDAAGDDGSWYSRVYEEEWGSEIEPDGMTGVDSGLRGKKNDARKSYERYQKFKDWSD